MSERKQIWPRRIVDYSKPWHYIRKDKDYIGFYCPCCYRPMIFRASITLNIQNVDKKSDSSVSIKPIYNIECNKCNNMLEFDYCLDPNITPMIAELNRKGYFTTNSCEGHRLNQQDYSLPYITFKYNGQRNVLNYIPLQGPWYLDNVVENAFIIRCDDLKVPIRERMAYLRKWVDALPYCFKEEFTSDLFTDEVEQSIAFKMLFKPLSDEDKSTKDELEAIDQNANSKLEEDDSKENSITIFNNTERKRDKDGYKYYFSPRFTGANKQQSSNNNKHKPSNKNKDRNKKYGNDGSKNTSNNKDKKQSNNHNRRRNNKKKYDK